MEKVDSIKKQKNLAEILFVVTSGLGLPSYGTSVLESTQAGIIGILCIPFIAKFMNERLNLKND